MEKTGESAAMIDIEAVTEGFIRWISGPNFRNPYSKATIRIYGRNVHRFLEFLDFDGVERVSEASIHLVRKFVMTGQSGGSAPINTQNVRTGALALFFDYLESTEEHGLFSGNPARALIEDQKHKKGGNVGKATARLRPVLEWDDMDRLQYEASKQETIAGIRDAALIGFIFDTGLRASEICALPHSAAEHYFQGRLRVIGKGDKERLVRFTPEHADRLRTWIRTRARVVSKSDCLFLTDEGNALSTQVLYMIVRRLLERAGIQKAQQGPHLLRHTAASRWLAKGMDLRQVQENMGHSNIGTTSKYLHLLG